MGWAKYYEDNMSIYIGRVAMIETTSCYCDRSENIRISTIKKRPLHISGKKTTFEKPRIAQMVPGRKGVNARLSCH